MPAGSIEVHTEDGSFLVWEAGGQLHCQVKDPSGPRDISYWNELPAGSIPEIQKAVDHLTARPHIDQSKNNFRWD